MNSLIKILMKRKIIIFFITISFALASWKLINPTFDNSNKDKLLIEIIKYVLEKYHYNSIEINDEFSKKAYAYFTSLPFLNVEEGATNSSRPSLSSAINIIPCDSIAFKFFGAKFTRTLTCFPIISSGLKNSAIPLKELHLQL